MINASQTFATIATIAASRGCGRTAGATATATTTARITYATV
jgi:hypothetical protein